MNTELSQNAGYQHLLGRIFWLQRSVENFFLFLIRCHNANPILFRCPPTRAAFDGLALVTLLMA